MPAVSDSKYLVTAGWDDVPHLDAKTKREMLDGTPPHLHDARSKGTPSLGMGAIYPIEQSQFIVQPFAIPRHFAKGYGLDVGWNRTAAAFGAWDRDADVLYIYGEHYQGEQPPSVHAAAIKARGNWLIGAIDPAAKGRSQRDGEQLMADYIALGLNVVPADNGVEAGILCVWELLAAGRLKVFSTCQAWLAEHRLYRRDERGHIVKANDHLMDATRYLARMRVAIMRTQPVTALPTFDQVALADPLGGY